MSIISLRRAFCIINGAGIDSIQRTHKTYAKLALLAIVGAGLLAVPLEKSQAQEQENYAWITDTTDRKPPDFKSQRKKRSAKPEANFPHIPNRKNKTSGQKKQIFSSVKIEKNRKIFLSARLFPFRRGSNRKPQSAG